MTLRARIQSAAAALATLGQPVTPGSLRGAIAATHGEAPSERTISRELVAMAGDGLAVRTGDKRGARWTVHRASSTPAES